MGRGTRKFASQPAAPALPAVPTVRGLAPHMFEVYTDLPWLRRVRIGAGDYTLLYSELLLPNSPEPWPRLDAFFRDWAGTRSRHVPWAIVAVDDPVDELLADTKALVAFHLPAFGLGGAFTPIKATPESLRTVYRYGGSAHDAYTVLRLSETSAVILGPEPTRLHSISRLHCDGCATVTAACWHTYLLTQERAPDATLVAHAALAVTSGEAIVYRGPDDKRAVQIELPGYPEISLRLHQVSTTPELTIVCGPQTWALRGQELLYGVSTRDVYRLAEAVQLRLAAMKDQELPGSEK